MRVVMILLCAAACVFAAGTSFSQEFPVAVGSDTTFSAGAVYGGFNGLVAVHGDAAGQNNITAQLVGSSGQMIGSRISLGATGVMPGAIPVFDGTNYFLVWLEFSGSLKGQFINTSGAMVGTSFVIASGISFDRVQPYGVTFGDSTFLACFVKADGYLYGQRVGRTGAIIGSQVQISSNYARDFSVAFDGTNYLAAWVEVIPERDKDIYGQFVSKGGALVGSNFLIDGGPYYSDNPTSLAFDGTRYLLGYHEAPANSNWTLMGRFITTSGSIQETITICDSTKYPNLPSVAFDHRNYLITWMQGINGSLMGRFYNTSGAPVDTPFVLFGPLGHKMPFGGVGFGGGLYLVVATRVDSNISNGDVYGRFVQPLTGVADERTTAPKATGLFQNYPNPFNPSTTIKYLLGEVRGQKSGAGPVVLTVYDVLGREVATLVNEIKPPGEYSVRFDASSLAGGVYFYRLQAGDYSATKKLLLLK